MRKPYENKAEPAIKHANAGTRQRPGILSKSHLLEEVTDMPFEHDIDDSTPEFKADDEIPPNWRSIGSLVEDWRIAMAKLHSGEAAE